MVKLFSLLYSLSWFLALPVLILPKRIRRGWEERTMQKAPPGPFDIWLQAASGGEAQMAALLLTELARTHTGRPLKILATSGTPEGVETLSKAAPPNLDVSISFFPFDAPFLMKKAFRRFLPKMAVIIETELWPGFLITARKSGIPIIVINGRMTRKSYSSYRLASSFFHKYGPVRVLAISEADRDRFTALLGEGKTRLMNNIKFDRITTSQAAPATGGNTEKITAESSPFIILGSVRQEEEREILKTIKLVLARRPEAVIGLFPKHLNRAGYWEETLKKCCIHVIKRSEAGNSISPGVVIWDRYGELAAAYALADAAFVGGSLADLGGQNFLEPLVCGLRPCIGPYWNNFSWVGTEVISTGLVRQVRDAEELAESLLTPALSSEERSRTAEEAQRYFEPRKGGTAQACNAVLTLLKSLPTYPYE